MPRYDEPVVDKPGKGAFFATDLGHLLRVRGITTLLICGVTTDCCVLTTQTDAVDLGFHCILLEDCCGAIRHEDHLATLELLRNSGGAFGHVRESREVLEELE